MGAVWDHSTGRGRNRVRLGGEKEGGVIVGEGERDGGEEGAGRVRLGGKEAKGSGDGDRGSESTLDSLEEATTHRSYPLGILVRIPSGTPGAEEVADLQVGEEAQQTHSLRGEAAIGREHNRQEAATNMMGTLFNGLMFVDLVLLCWAFHLGGPVGHGAPLVAISSSSPYS